MNHTENIQFIKVSGLEWQVKVLYQLLKDRRFYISHNKMPNYETHKLFVNKNPYKIWYLIKKNEVFVGSYYIKDDNSIGLNLTEYSYDILKEIIEFIKHKFTPEVQSPSKIPPYFYINTSVKDEALHLLLEELNLKPLQISYKF